MTARALGRRKPSGKPALRLALTGVPAHPVAVDHLTRAGLTFGLYANNRVSDCGPTSIANLRRLMTAWLGPTMEVPTLEDVFDLYRRSGNPDFDPATGAGDRGVDMQTMLEALLSGGIGGRKPLAFAKLDGSVDAIRAAVAIFGGVLLGVDLEVAQQGQSDAGVWDYSRSGEWGGHAVLAAAYADPDGTVSDRLGVISWAETIEATDVFLERQLSEAWVVLWPENLTDPGFLAGVDLAAMAADYQELTGRPFPAIVSPTPDPGPFPADLVAAAQALAADPDVIRFERSHHFGYLTKVAELVRVVTGTVR